MALAEADKTEIQEMIAAILRQRSPADLTEYGLQIHERMVRVEEELKHQRSLMEQGFKLMEKRFEQVDKRFEQMDKRFEALTRRIDRFMIWSFGVTVSVGGLVIAVIKYLP